jgi:quinol monooxygenase YgiN
MIYIVAKSVIKNECRDEYIKAAKELVAKSQKEAGCIAYNLYEGVNKPNILTFIEQWRDQAALAAHSQSEHYKAIVPKLADMREKGEVQLYTLVP